MTWEPQTTRDDSGILWSAISYPIPCMAHIIQLALGTFMSSLQVNGCTKLWDAHECDQQFGENESTDIGKNQTQRNIGNARISKASAMRPCFAKIIEKVSISRYCESPETVIHIAQNASCIYYADSWSSK
jgi:hypothetical protein